MVKKATSRKKAVKKSARATKAKVVPRSEKAVYERIRERAYELYLARGEQHGHSLRDWLDAERELLAKLREGVGLGTHVSK